MTVLRYLIYFAIGYSLVVAATYYFQRSLIYFPDRGKPSEQRLAAMGLKFWPDANNFKGLASINSDHPMSNGTAIVFHGNAGAAWHRDYFSDKLEPLGYRVILAEYPGYGGRTGSVGEAHFVRDAREIITRTRSQFGDPIYLIGESMGCGVAAAVAGGDSNVSGVIMITPWDSLPRVAQTHYWYLPARWLVRDQYNNIENLRSFDKPVAVAMAGNDQVIPNKHTMNLYTSLSPPKRMWEFKDAGHNSWPASADQTWWREVMAFVSSQNRPYDGNTD